MRRVLAALAAVFLGLATGPLGVAPEPAGAQAPATSTAAIRLIEQTPWVSITQPFAVELALSGVTDTADLELVAVLHPAVGTRSAFAQTLEGRGLGRTMKSYPVALDGSTTNERGNVSITFALPRIDTPASSTSLPALPHGVYPMTFSVRPRGGGTALASLTTHLVRLPEGDTGVPLDVAWVQPLSTPPAESATTPGSTSSTPDQDGIRAFVEAMAGASQVPIELDLTPETIAGASETTTRALRALIDARHPVLAAPYVDVDPTALVDAGRGEDLPLQIAAGGESLFSTIGTRGDIRTWSIEQLLSASALARLRALGVTRVVLPESTLRPIPGLSRTLTSPYAVDAGDGNVVEGVSADAGLSGHFRNRDDQVLAAHQFLADLAVIYFDAPSSAHGVVVRPPSSWRPDPAFLDVVLPALTGAPIIQPVTLDRLLSDVPAMATRNRPTVRSLATGGRTNALPAARLANAHTTVTELESLLDPSGEIAQRSRRLLLASESTRLSSTARSRVLDELDGVLDRIRANVQLPDGRTFRLAAREGRIPLTVVNDNDVDVKVEIVLSSDKLEFTEEPAGNRSSTVLRDVVLRANSTFTRAIPVKARASATFSLQAVVRAPTGQELDRSRFTITSTAFSGVGIVLSIGAALFLAVWWIRHWRSSRPDRPVVDPAH
jgi:hypothetical protein